MKHSVTRWGLESTYVPTKDEVQHEMEPVPDGAFVKYDDYQKTSEERDEILTALEELLSLTEHVLEDKATSSEFYDAWQAISAQTADWRDGDDV